MNNRVYRTGFASTQAAYDEHVVELFKMLDELETLLADGGQGSEQRKYLVGKGEGQFTEADLRYVTVFSPTLFRSDWLDPSGYM